MESVSKAFAAETVLADVDLEVAAGEFMAILGPSGSGKSTLLRLIAGLESPDEGVVSIDDLPVGPPGTNPVAMVFEDAALYEHLDVGGNLALPMRVRRMSREEVEASVQRRARRTGIRRLLARRPRTLSGGERGLVAVGRALGLPGTKVLLLDEPLSQADKRLRVRFRSWLAGLDGVTIVLATNDQEEAMALADRIAVIDGGAIVQVAPPVEVYRNPATRAVAAFIGRPPMNLFPAAVDGDVLEVGADRVSLEVSLGGLRDGARAVLGIHPADLHLAGPGAEFETVLHATTGRVEALGSHYLVWFGLGSSFGASYAFLSREVVSDGRRIELTWERGRERLFDAASGVALPHR